jgi:hypothetical protein
MDRFDNHSFRSIPVMTICDPTQNNQPFIMTTVVRVKSRRIVAKHDTWVESVDLTATHTLSRPTTTLPSRCGHDVMTQRGHIYTASGGDGADGADSRRSERTTQQTGGSTGPTATLPWSFRPRWDHKRTCMTVVCCQGARNGPVGHSSRSFRSR